jgi:hypothetical protein
MSYLLEGLIVIMTAAGVCKYREMLSVSIRAAHKFDTERFILMTLQDVNVRA